MTGYGTLSQPVSLVFCGLINSWYVLAWLHPVIYFRSGVQLFLLRQTPLLCNLSVILFYFFFLCVRLLVRYPRVWSSCLSMDWYEMWFPSRLYTLSRRQVGISYYTNLFLLFWDLFISMSLYFSVLSFWISLYSVACPPPHSVIWFCCSLSLFYLFFCRIFSSFPSSSLSDVCSLPYFHLFVPFPHFHLAVPSPHFQ